jgi:TRAP-type C4-dicarboxylate transport system permease small subunit
MRSLDRAAALLSAAALAIAAVLTAAMAIAIIYTVGARFAFNRTPPWTEELPRILMIWSVFIGMIWTTSRNANLRAGLLALWARGRVEASMRCLAEALVLVFCVLLAVTAAEMVDIVWYSTTPALEMTAAIFYLPLAVGGAMTALVQVPRVLGALAEACRR